MSSELSALLNGQRDLHGRMSRSVDNLKKMGASNITPSAIETRIKLLDQMWANVETQHDLIRAAYKERYDETPTGERSNEHASKTALSCIKLPQFSGAYEDWSTFRDLFLSVIGDNSSIFNVEWFHYLRSCLQRSAEKLIRPLAVTGENYTRAWAFLEKHYENKKELIHSNFAAFTAVAKIKADTAEELSRVYHAVTAAVNAQESIGRPIETHGMDLFNHLIIDLFDPRTRLEWESSTCDFLNPPEHDTLLNFLTKRILTLNAAKPRSAAKVTGDASRSAKSHFTKYGSSSSLCALCKEHHSIMQCSGFKAKSASDRKSFVEANKLCYNCLGNHPVARCQSTKNCFTCKARHHTMLHDAHASPKPAKVTALSATREKNDGKAILLATARVLVADRHGDTHEVRVLIDQGSEVSIISEALAQRLRLLRSRSKISVVGVGGAQSGSTRGRVTLELTSRVTGAKLSVMAFVLPRLSLYRGSTRESPGVWRHVQGLPLADPQYYTSDPIELLLGAEVCSVIFEDGLRKGGPQAPIAQRTTLRWILSGGCGTTSLNTQRSSLQCTADHDLAELLQRFWEQEKEPSAAATFTPEEQRCEDFLQTHERTPEERYMVRLPFSSAPTALGETRRPAERLLAAMERKCAQDLRFGELYRTFMHEYHDLQHMELVNAPLGREEHTCYLPHHGVLCESSATTKLRVVFNESQRTRSGKSLNAHFFVDTNLLPALSDVVLRW
nr:PREDICTED: uncharacterized protein LOC105677796 [Linepithema humile]